MPFETEGRRQMMSGNEVSFVDDLEKDMGFLLHEQRRQKTADELERELNLYRSGSAPPTVEGSLNAVGGLFGRNGDRGSALLGGAKSGDSLAYDEDFRSDPAYLSYYYANVNLNPRLPPPMLSREDLRVAQRLKGGTSTLGGIGDRRNVNNGAVNNNNGNYRSSLFSLPPGFESRNSENNKPVDCEKVPGSAEWGGGDSLIGLPGLGLGTKKSSLAEIFQDDSGNGPPVSQRPSRPASRNAFDENIAATNNLVPSGSQAIGPGSSYSYAAVVGASLSRSTTPDPQAVARAPSPCLTPIGSGRVSASEKRSLNSPNSFVGVSSGVNVSSDLAAALSGIDLSGGSEGQHQHEVHVEKHRNYMFGLQAGHDEIKQQGFLHNSEQLQKPAVPSRNPHVKGSQVSTFNGGFGSPRSYQHSDSRNSSFSNYGSNNYSPNAGYATMMASQLGTMNLPPLFENAAAASALGLSGINSRVVAGGFPSSGQNFNESYNTGRISNQMVGGGPLQAPFADPMYLQYLRTSDYAAQLAALNDPSMDGTFMGNSYANSFHELQKSYLGVPRSQNGDLYKSGAYYGSPTFGFGLSSFPGSPMANHVIPNSPVGPGSPMRRSELNLRFPAGTRNNFSGSHLGPWHLDGGLGDGFGSSLLEEFKSNKLRCFELAEIRGHVVEFSGDQYGSRFIQQKLETATVEEKNMVYEEIMPQALVLMTDVFGNYVIQKLFEHGIASHRRELAENLFGNVLQLSLQMYGCRVIQKAIEVVDVDQKVKMVHELDGHVMRCVRDQNGNHVIQKCIECVPEENIQFIISTFFDQVVTLSTHPYGCRVIQRVLEYCKDQNTQSKVMEEILNSISMLAQDQYGNYVVQHVLEHGLPHERTFIIKELAGKIVQMSQQKFASNVVEKCLTFGDPSERELLVNEMLGSTDENEPLQAMMKDQFANYVVQKVLETCDEQQREHILNRIKVHLNALKKYTYGKHIVARVEKLVAAGERRIAADSLNMSLVAEELTQLHS